MADEPGMLVAAFVAHHLELGAAEVHVCLDRPNDEARDLLARVTGAVLHDAGEDGWAFHGTGHRPARMNARQKYHASRMLAETRLDWILHCDADEFMQPAPEGDSIAARLARVAPAMNWVQVAVAERVYLRRRPQPDIFAGAFRLPWAEFAREGQQIYDADTRELLQAGLCGHRMGKAMVRSGRGLFIGVHHGLRRFSGEERCPAVEPGGGLRILHFDGLSELHFVLKMLRYGLEDRPDNPTRHSRARQVQIAAMQTEAGAAERLRALHSAAKFITPAQAQALSSRGLLRRWQPEIAARVRRVLGPEFGLSPAAFDRALIGHEAALIGAVQARLGFDPQEIAAK